MGWSLVIPALVVLGDSAHSFGKRTWWLNEHAMATWTTIIPFVLPLGAALAAAWNWRRWPYAGLIAVAGLGLTAWADAGRTSPGVAIGEAVLAVTGLATTLAALAGRVLEDQAPLPSN
jgi:hypothetical protein